MSNKLFIIGLFFASFALQSCNSVASQNSEPEVINIAPAEVKQETPQPRKDEFPNQQKVEFKGVSFTYNPQILGELEVKEVNELPLKNETDKADSVVPQHLFIKFKKTDFRRKTEIYIFPVADYRRMYAVSNELTERFDDELKALEMTIKDKNFRLKNQIPFIPTWDGSQTFQSKVKQFSFQNGKGIFFLTQFDIETSLINNGSLTYCFEGITNDKKFYVLGLFPVKTSFLPEYYEREFEGYKIPEKSWDMNKNEVKQYKNYISKVTKRLENLSSDKYNPSLDYFQEMISSLKIEK